MMRSSLLPPPHPLPSPLAEHLNTSTGPRQSRHFHSAWLAYVCLSAPPDHGCSVRVCTWYDLQQKASGDSVLVGKGCIAIFFFKLYTLSKCFSTVRNKRDVSVQSLSIQNWGRGVRLEDCRLGKVRCVTCTFCKQSTGAR